MVHHDELEDFKKTELSPGDSQTYDPDAMKKQASQDEVIIIDEGKQAKAESRDNSTGMHQRGNDFKVERNVYQ